MSQPLQPLSKEERATLYYQYLAASDEEGYARLGEYIPRALATIDQLEQKYEAAGEALQISLSRLVECQGTIMSLNAKALETKQRQQKLMEALKPFAEIHCPSSLVDGSWVAKTEYCNKQVTAFSVRKARAALREIGEQG